MVSVLLLLAVAAVMLIIFIRVMRQKPKFEIAPGFILDDSRFVRNRMLGTVLDDTLEAWSYKQNSPLAGHSIVSFPREQTISLNFTSPPGGSSSLYYSLCFQLRKWEYQVHRADEWIEVSPVHQAYYQLTQKQKEELENKIKSGLDSAARTIADMELLKHDERKYREFLAYFGIEYDNNSKQFTEDPKKRDEHSIKAMFIDQVDVHSGEGISMRSIVSRWPTLITDFLKISDDDTDPDKLKDKLDVSKAEAVVLVTKNKVYKQWKKLFEPQLKERYQRITELVKSRETSVTAYREWLRPFIARHKLIEEALARPDEIRGFKTSFATPLGSATSVSKTVLWAWRELTLPEIFKGGTERLARELDEGKINVYDEWTKKTLIFNKEHGLIAKYPWVTDKWVEAQKTDMLNAKSGTPSWLIKHKLYYSFFNITLTKTNIKSPTGAEMEDGVFEISAVLMSANALFVKLLELRAKQEDMNRYIDSLMGIGPKAIEGKIPEYKERRYLQPLKNFAGFFGLNMQFIKRGPYERDYKDRMTKYWSGAMGGLRYKPVVEFIKRKMSMGE